MQSKLVVILGPTASGKSALGIKLAKKFNGEIISADSRQVYKGMDIGTGKITKREQKLIPHHLLDVADPKRQYSAAKFAADAKATIKKIVSRGKIPFVVGGTAFYIYALTGDVSLTAAKPNRKLRIALDKKSTKELGIILKNLDPKRYKTIDKQNRVRLIRAIEINVQTGKPVPPNYSLIRANKEILFLGINPGTEKLRKLISKRVEQRLKQGLVKETKRLIKSGVSPKRLAQIGLTYKIASDYIQGKIEKDQLAELITTAEYQFAKRQMTWFKKDPRILWIKNPRQAEKLIKNYLKN